MRGGSITAAVSALVVIACAQSAPELDASGSLGGVIAASDPAPQGAAAEQPAAPAALSAPADAPEHALPAAVRPANEMGRIPVLEYHLFGEEEGRWQRSYAGFRNDLALLYERGYRPITAAALADRKIDLPAGLSPVVITFDDASPGQFRYLEENGTLGIDPNSAVGIWLEFSERHPDWSKSGVFCMLSAAEAGRSFFGDKNIEGQRSEWRLRKVRFLAEQGFELCNHTLWHANLSQYDDLRVQEQIARGNLAIDSAVAGYRVRTFALPLGQWPKNRDLTYQGEWTEPKSGRTIRYQNDLVLMVAGGPARSPYDTLFDPRRVPRVQVFGDELVKLLDRLESGRYVSDGNAGHVTRPN